MAGSLRGGFCLLDFSINDGLYPSGGLDLCVILKLLKSVVQFGHKLLHFDIVRGIVQDSLER